MIASRFETRYWSWIVLGIYALAFCFWPLDRHDVAGFLTKMFPATAVGTGLGYLVAAAIAAGAAALMTWTSAYVQTGGSSAETLVTRGPYRLLRNPQFLGIWVCCFAFGLLLNFLGLAVVTVGTALFFYRLIRREEIQLAVVHGLSYERYCAAIPRVVSVPSHGSIEPSVKPMWTRGLLGGAHFWVLAAALVALAFTLSEAVFFAFLGAAALVRVVAARLPN